MMRLLVQYNIVSQYLAWQFFDMPLAILKVWGGLLKYNLNYFSVLELAKTLFSPWRRYHEKYAKFDPWKIYETFVFNMMSRIIGAILRVGLMVAGIVLEILILAGGVVVLAVWTLMPVIIVALFFYGIGLLAFGS